jgi:signal transduction histidine kinase
VLRTPSAELRRIAESWFPFGVHIISGLMQTVRRIESMARQREKLIALGTLSAGLAHELNNPASAATRAVDALSDATEMLIGAIGPLGGSALSAEQCAALEGLRQEAMTASPGGDGSSLRESDREDAIADWLDDHGVDRSWVIAAALAAAGVDDSFCERVLDAVGPDALGPGLQLVAGSVSTGQLLAEVRDATSRISGLVGAVKSYSQMDRASVQLTNVVDGLESTLVMLTHKLRGVDVHREWAADLPKVKAIPGELNQVWTNLIDNAVDAMGGSGTLEVTARVDGDRLVVAVVDDGPGMSAEVLERAFDPFFTTKEVGKGTGLGLDISRRIVVEHHSGDISIDSQPGRTWVSVALPLVH